MRFSRGHWHKISWWKFCSFDQQGKHCTHVLPRATNGVTIVGTDVLFGNCREEANFLEVTKVQHARYSSKKCYQILKGRGRVKFWDNLLPEWYPRKFCLSH